jgi:transcriptional regulator with XRE-family HTH domain
MKERLDRDTGIELRRMLVGSGVTQADMAEILGVDESAMSRILSGRQAMPDGFADKFRLSVRTVS